jgi:hypothetical protein
MQAAGRLRMNCLSHLWRIAAGRLRASSPPCRVRLGSRRVSASVSVSAAGQGRGAPARVSQGLKVPLPPQPPARPG